MQISLPCIAFASGQARAACVNMERDFPSAGEPTDEVAGWAGTHRYRLSSVKEHLLEIAEIELVTPGQEASDLRLEADVRLQQRLLHLTQQPPSIWGNHAPTLGTPVTVREAKPDDDLHPAVVASSHGSPGGYAVRFARPWTDL